MTTEFISIGPYCVSAEYLKNTNNRKLAFPFDWIFSSLNMISHCVQDEFKTFLNTDYIKFINEQQSSHIIYDKLLNKRLDGAQPVVFNHHNLGKMMKYIKHINNDAIDFKGNKK